MLDSLGRADVPDAGAREGWDAGHGVGRTVAAGHFRRQLVEVTDVSGRSFHASFVANYRVFDDGRASGSFTLFSDRTMRVFRISAGRIVCGGRLPALVLTGAELGAASGRSSTFEVSLTPVGGTDNPECIIWDIKDSCSHEAQGKYDVAGASCPGS